MYDRYQIVSLTREVPGQAVSWPLVQVEVSGCWKRKRVRLPRMGGRSVPRLARRAISTMIRFSPTSFADAYLSRQA
jgi:hypothetical protein